MAQITDLEPEVLDLIVEYIEHSKPRKARAGYTYEPDSDDSEEEDESDEDEKDEDLDDYDSEDEDASEEDGYSSEESFGSFIKDGFPLRLRDLQYSPKYHLRPLLLVCKIFHRVAEPRLYRSVSVGSDSEDKWGTPNIEGADHAISLAETLKNNARLAALVRELRLATLSCAREETVAHAELLSICTNTNRVVLFGYNGYVLGDLRSALEKLSLQSLMVSRHNLRDQECDGFCSLDQLFGFMMNWPNFESVEFQNNSTSVDGLSWNDDGEDGESSSSSDFERFSDEWESDPEEELDEWEIEQRKTLREMDDEREKAKPLKRALRAKILDPPRNGCAQMRSFVLRECWPLHVPHLRALERMAPHLEIFKASCALYAESQRAAIRSCLETWGPTLKELDLTATSTKSPIILDEGLCRQYLTCLRTLRTNSLTMKISSLVDFKGTLQQLDLSVMNTSDVNEIASCIPMLSNLEKLNLWTMKYSLDRYSSSNEGAQVNISKDSVEALGKICRQTGIKFQGHC